MKTSILLIIGIAMALLSGCATQNTNNPATAAMTNADPVQQTVAKMQEPSTPDPGPPPMMVAEKLPTDSGKDLDCSLRGKRVILDGRQIGITIQPGYCSANLKPAGSSFWIPEAEIPALGNIHVDDPCNITYCPTSAHYDHFGITDGKNSIQVQVRWQNDQAVIY